MAQQLQLQQGRPLRSFQRHAGAHETRGHHKVVGFGEQDNAVRLGHPQHLRDDRLRIGHVDQHRLARHHIERSVFKRKPAGVGFQVVRGQFRRFR